MSQEITIITDLCVEAFKYGDKQDAERLLPQLIKPANIRTAHGTAGAHMPRYNRCYTEQMSLLHLAAHYGWMDIAIDLITKYKCDTNCKDSDGCTPLHHAVINNHLEVVRYFINEQHCDPMTRDNDGHTPLHYAVINNHPKVIRYFINEQHCDPMTRDNDGNTPLHIACIHSRTHMVQYLLSTGKLDPLAKNKYGKRANVTPNDIYGSLQFSQGEWRHSLLHLAAHNGWMNDVIDLITKYKCDTNCKDSDGRTPLHYAVINNHLEVIRYFINEQHCDPMTRDNDGNTPLHIACIYSSSTHIVQYLLSTGKLDPLAKNKYGKRANVKPNDIYGSLQFSQGEWRHSLLHLAAHHGWMNDVIELITKYKCDTNCKDSHGCTPLHYAVINSHLEVVRYFINEQHCDPMTTDNDGKTPLHYAVINNHLEVVRYFINEQHCDPMTTDNDGKTPLHYAVINNHLEVVRYFINEQHCDPMTTDTDGNTPLHLACKHGHIHTVLWLLSTGDLDPLAKNKYGETALFIQNHKTTLPLLHLAAQQGWMDIIIDLITVYKCDTNCKDSHGRTPLHYAVNNNHLEVVRYFINEQHCDPMTRDNDGNTPLHLACRGGNAFTVKYLLSTGRVDPLAENKNFKIPMYTDKQYQESELPLLHLAAQHGWMDIIQYLITKYKCDTNCKDSYKCIPLHYAVTKNHLKVVKYFINEQYSDPMARDNFGDTALHYACDYGHIDIVQYLLSTDKVDPLATNNDGGIAVFKQDKIKLPLLHLAAHHGWMDIIIDLITKYKCDTNCKDSHGHTPLHYTVINNHLEVVRYFINEQHSDPMTRDNDGNTPLHLACNHGHVHIVQYLLSTGKVDPLAENKNAETPLDIASRQDHNYDLLKQFQSFPQCEKDFPVHTYTKLILTGYSGAGKTTISQLILLLAKETGFFSWLSSGRVTDVECLTAGIIPLHVESKVNELGNMVIYDFAGQQEYYSSHGAVLERIMRNSAAIFACIVDLSQCMDKIRDAIHYWISFIENACSSAQGSSHVIIVGSHADLVKSSQKLKEKSSLVEGIAESRAKKMTYGGLVSLDCRLSKTTEAHHFRSLISTSQQAILSSQPSMSLYCHVLYAFLRTKLGMTGCTLQELTSALASDKFFSPDSTVLTESLISLSDKGLILFIENLENPQFSWVVAEKEALLREVNGTLFAPDHFKQYRQAASNTGIVPIATLEELFPRYSSEMLVGCLESMEFCHPVDLSTLQATNLKATSSSPPSGAYHLFFPSLVKEHRPSDLPSPRFGWCLGCSDPHQFFSNRFLHVLFLRLAFTYSLATIKRSLPSTLCGIERTCEVWQNGICWKSASGVSTIVEIVDLNRWVIVLVSEKTREAAQTCSSVIRMILDLQHQLCSAVTTCECLISPSLLDGYPFDALPDTDLFDLPTVARSMLLHHKLLLDRSERKNEFSTDAALSCEPYYLLQPSSVCSWWWQVVALEISQKGSTSGFKLLPGFILLILSNTVAASK